MKKIILAEEKAGKLIELTVGNAPKKCFSYVEELSNEFCYLCLTGVISIKEYDIYLQKITTFDLATRCGLPAPSYIALIRKYIYSHETIFDIHGRLKEQEFLTRFIIQAGYGNLVVLFSVPRLRFFHCIHVDSLSAFLHKLMENQMISRGCVNYLNSKSHSYYMINPGQLN